MSFGSRGVVKCLVKSCLDDSAYFDFDAIVLPRICSSQPRTLVDRSQWAHVKSLKLADVSCHQPNVIDMLIGAELLPYMLGNERIFGFKGQPVATESVFGWVLQGRASCDVPTPPKVVTLSTFLEPSLETLVSRFWDIEAVPTKPCLTADEQKCNAIFAETTKRDKSGRFIVSLPFKKDNQRLGESYIQATRRFRSLENRLLNQPALYKEYSDFMLDYLHSGHMTELLTDHRSPLAYYIPHHAVLKLDSTTTRLRVVFDASAKTSNGLSLNDNLLVGPKLQRDIFDILLHFRTHEVVFTCDIRQMYRQILLDPEHRDFQRILWRDSVSEPLREFRLNTVTYGVSSSPYLALRTLQELATSEKDSFPRASTAILHHTYVDDVVTGAKCIEDALLLQAELVELFKLGGFELRKWSSNHCRLVQNVEPALQTPVAFDREEPQFVKVLGLKWNPSTDAFTYSHASLVTHCTKRTMLSEIARIYDPLGFLAPVTLYVKHLMQKLWLSGIAWDDPPPPQVHEAWNRFRDQLPLLGTFEISRCFIRGDATHVELHGFSDASQIGYGAALYLRVTYENETESMLCCAKAKVASVKTVSLPRLELLGAVLLANLTRQFLKNENLPIDKVRLWSDSEIVLTWIASHPGRWKTFVANRVSLIQELVPETPWFHVPSVDNPADCASRGLLPLDLREHSLWWHGPRWLTADSTQWPSQPDKICLSSYDSSFEIAPNACLLCAPDVHPFDDLLLKCSSLPKIQRIVSYALRFIRRGEYETYISPKEMDFALMLLIQYVQRACFQDLFKCFKHNSLMPKPLRKLSLFLDNRGLIRVGGRLKHSNLDYESKHPLLLPSNHPLVNRIVEMTHRVNLHPGFKTLSSLLLQRFWILSPRKVLHRTLSRCYRCFRARPKSLQPIMSDLPACRVSQIKAFCEICLDYAGPFSVVIKRSRGARAIKMYVCVLVCCATKAIHLEMVTDLTSEAFLAALQRFVARRGRCNAIHSDQGTNFVGAARLLQEFATQTAKKLEISWHFNPPSAPHFNGLAEAGVKSFKTHFYRVIGDQILSHEEFQTLLTRIEALLNSRPLCPLSSDPNDLQPLTPGHFLVLEPLINCFSEPDYSEIPETRLSRWQLISRMHAHFWERWSRDYLHTLQQRGKWNTKDSSQEALLDRLVLIKSELKAPIHWNLGRVLEVHPGKDGVVRVVTLRTANGRLQRPLVKVCPLPIQ